MPGAMYDEDYLYFCAAPDDRSEFAVHGAVLPGAGVRVQPPWSWPGGCSICGRARRLTFVKRLFGFPELRDWLLAAGFTPVTGYGEDARPLTAGHQRMVVVASLP